MNDGEGGHWRTHERGGGRAQFWLFPCYPMLPRPGGEPFTQFSKLME